MSNLLFALIVALVSSSFCQVSRAELPQSHSYLEHLPKLSQFVSAAQNEDQSYKAYPEAPDQIHSAEQANDRNPILHLTKSYWNLLRSILDLNPEDRPSYWQNLRVSADQAIANTTAILGDSVNDLGETINAAEARRSGWIENPAILQCTSALPFTRNESLEAAEAISQMKHTWLQVGQRTYGMPYTLDHHIFGGDAVVNSPDVFQGFTLEDVACTPVYQQKDESPEVFQQRLKCIADKAATTELGVQTRQLILNYHFLRENCLAAVRMITECAGGRIPQIPNLNIGGQLNSDHFAKIRYKDDSVIETYDRLFQAIEELDHFLEAALSLNGNLKATQFLQDAAPFLTRIRTELTKASDFLDQNYPKRQLQAHWHSDGITYNEHWLHYALARWDGELQDAQSFEEISTILFWIAREASLDYPSVHLTTLGEVCETFQDECSTTLTSE